jgi:hypothetical protein
MQRPPDAWNRGFLVYLRGLPLSDNLLHFETEGDLYDHLDAHGLTLSSEGVDIYKDGKPYLAD